MLRCVSKYKAGELSFAPGEIVDNAALERHLLTDSPGSFEAVREEAPAPPDGPPVDKMIKRATKKAEVKDV